MRRRRRPDPFERAIRRAKTWVDDDGNSAILIPADHANWIAAAPHAHRVAGGGILFAVDQDTLAEMVADTLASIDADVEQTETFRRRVVVLRKLCGPTRWADAEETFEQAKAIATRHPALEIEL